jgi:hypothetical protein
MLEEFHQDGNWANEIRNIKNPFGQGDSGKRIVQVIVELLTKGEETEQQLTH